MRIIQGTTNRRLIAMILAGTVLLAALVLTGVLSWTDDASSAAQPQTTATSSPAATDSELSIFRSSNTASISEIPETLSSALSLLPATENSREKGTVEKLGVVPGGSSQSEVVVAKVSQRICIFAAGTDYQGAAVGSCFSAAEVEAGKGFVAVQGMENGLARVIGIAPNGVARVSIDSGDDGRTDAVVDVSANVYLADLKTVPTVVSGVDPDGNVEFETEMPLSVGAH